MPETYRKKPVEVQAIQLSWRNWGDVCEFLGDALATANVREVTNYSDTTGEPGPTYIELTVITEHRDPATVQHGDWILPEPTRGRFYPVKPDIFAATYEKVVPTDA